MDVALCLRIPTESFSVSSRGRAKWKIKILELYETHAQVFEKVV